MYEDDYLQHYGVLGMKWGVRKKRVSSGRKRKSKTNKSGQSLFERIRKRYRVRKNKKTSNRKQESSSQTKKETNVKKMTTDELKNKISRLELEKKYRDLKSSERTRTQKLVNDIVYKSFENIGTQALTYAMGAALNKAVSKGIQSSLDKSGEKASAQLEDALKGIVNPRKGQTDKKK